MSARNPDEREARRRAKAITRIAAWEEQRTAIEALAKEPGPLGRLVLLELLTHRAISIRGKAMDVCAGIGGAIAVVAAWALCSDASSAIRGDALLILGEHGGAQDLGRLTQGLSDPDWMVRSDAAEALEALRLKRSLQPLLQAYAVEKHPVVRRDIAQALGRLGDPETVPVLEQALERPRGEQELLGILNALYWLGRRERLDEWLSLLDSDDYTIRYAVIHTIAELKHPEDRARAAEALARRLSVETSRGVRINNGDVLERLRGV